MASFQCIRRDVKDASGNVEVTSVVWNEGIEPLESLAATAHALALFVGIGAVLLGFLMHSRPADQNDAMGCWMVGVAALMAGGLIDNISWPRTWRNLAFFRDGTILAPHGTAFSSERFEFAKPYTQIVSIEAVTLIQGEAAQTAIYTEGVALYTRGGDKITVAESLTKREAHKVAVQLTLAVQELRMAVAVRPTPALPVTPPPLPAHTRAHGVIN